MRAFYWWTTRFLTPKDELFAVQQQKVGRNYYVSFHVPVPEIFKENKGQWKPMTKLQGRREPLECVGLGQEDEIPGSKMIRVSGHGHILRSALNTALINYN